jgi:hypothetical protein
MDNIDTGDEDTVLYFDYVKIYKKLLEMGLEYEQMEKLCVDMLYETHKRKVLTALSGSVCLAPSLYETRELKVLTLIKNIRYI